VTTSRPPAAVLRRELAAGYGSGSSGYELINPSAASATAISFTGSPPNAGDFRLGITFTDSSHVLGTQGSSLYRYSSFSGSTGTLLASPGNSRSGWRHCRPPAGLHCVGRCNRCSRYKAPATPCKPLQRDGSDCSRMDSQSEQHHRDARSQWATPPANWPGAAVTINGDGSVSEDLYAMSTGQGIQAFDITVTPEPATFSLLAIGLGAVVCRKKFSR